LEITQRGGVDFKKILNEINKANLKVGWSNKAQYEDGTFVAVVAAQNEFGNPAKNIPPRSFMRTTVSEKTNEWKSTSANLFKMVFSEQQTPKGALETMGLLVAGNIREKIASITAPALAESTIKSRIRGRKVGNKTTSQKPLVDTGYMLNSLTSEVIG